MRIGVPEKSKEWEDIKKILGEIKKDIPFVRDRLYSAFMHPERYNLFDKFKSEIDKF